MESTGYALTDRPSEQPGSVASTTTAEVTQEAEADSGYRYADGEQILRSHQRDSEHVDRLRELLTDVARNIQGSRWVIARSTALEVASKLLYFGLTFGAASQTLGEEYVEILPYAVKRHNFPSRTRRLLSVLALSLIPTLWRSLVSALQPAPVMRQSAQTRARETRRAVLHRLLTSEAVKRLPEAWFIYFLLRGRNVEWSKSLFGLRYITPVPERQGGAPTYEAVGVLLAMPLLQKVLNGWRSHRTVQEDESNGIRNGIMEKDDAGAVDHAYMIDSHPALPSTTTNNALAHTELEEAHTILPPAQLRNPARPQCPLCLAPRGVAPESGGTCVTECGHVFCWSCIQEWGHEKKECPLCRQALRLERLIPGYNL